jgi:DNA mismatch repair protein MutS2
MDLKSRQLLEFNRILEIVAGFTGFSRSREMVLALEPSVDINEVSDALAKSAEARKLMESEPGFSLDGIKDITAFTLAAARGKVLDTLQLLDIAQAVNICSRVQAVICSRGKDLPLITCLAGRMVDLKALEKDITSSYQPGRGGSFSSSSPRLPRTEVS